MSVYLPDPVLPDPHPRFEPVHVVAMQLDALQNNDLYRDDAGIRAAFQFASPTNRSMTGPVEHFIHLVKNPMYEVMIGFQEARLGPVQKIGNRAVMQVDLIRTFGPRASFVFTLSRQTGSTHTGCWMTDSVLRIK